VSSTPAAGNEPPSYRGYRYPVEIISHAVWLYFRFHLSLRDVEELLAERGVTVTYEMIRAWCSKFGPSYAAGLRRRRARPSDKWHLDEVQLRSRASVIGCGVRSTSTASSSMSWCSSDAISMLPKPSFGESSCRRAANRGW
jgi:putative transposase